VADAELKQKVEELIAANPVLLFMKGTPEAPRCGFSMRVVQVLDAIDVEYGAVDVLPALQPLREVTTEISDWQTFPQLYVNGELLGGADIVEEMFDSGELAEALGVECKVGIATRPVRVVLLSIGLVFGAGDLITDVDLLPAAIYAMAGLTAFTVGQRVWHVRGELKAIEASEL